MLISPVFWGWPAVDDSSRTDDRLALGRGSAILVGLAIACGGSRVEPAAPPSAQPSVLAAPIVTVDGDEGTQPRRLAPQLAGTDWGWLEAPAFSLRVPVPDRAAWSVVEQGRWFVARHGSTGSTLSARAWGARRTVTREECEEELWLGKPELNAFDPATLIEESSLVEPAGFDSRLRAWALPEGRGVALTTGAGHRRCYAVVFETRADRVELGVRLQLAAERIVSRVDFRSVEEVRRPLRSGPSGL